MTDKRQKVTRSNVNKIYPLQNSQYLWNMFFFRWSIWVFLHLLHKNSRKKHKLANLHLWPFMRKGGLWISLKTVNFFHGHGAWIRVFTAWISNSTPVHSLREFFTLGVKLIMLRKISEDFHAVKLRVNTFSRREIKHVEGEWNLTCFCCFVFFLAPFRTGKKREYLVTSS